MLILQTEFTFINFDYALQRVLLCSVGCKRVFKVSLFEKKFKSFFSNFFFRVRKRNFSVPLPSERTLDIRDGKNENQLNHDQDKDGLLREEDGEEEEEGGARNPAPAFTTFRTTTTPSSAKRNLTILKSSDWIPLFPTESSESISPSTGKRNTTASQPPTTQQTLSSSTARTTLVIKRNITTTHLPPTQDPSEISTTLRSSTARQELSDVSTLKSSTARQDLSTSNQSVAESNVSVLTAKPETTESQLPFGSRTTTAKQTPLETPRTTTIRLVSGSDTPTSPTQTSIVQETSSFRSSMTSRAVENATTSTTTTASPPVFGSRTTTTTTSKFPDQPDSSSLRPVLKRPPVTLETTTRLKPPSTEPIKEESITTPPDTTPKGPLESTGHVSRTRVRLRESLIGRFQGVASNVTQVKNFNAARSFARNLDEVNATAEVSNDKSVQLSRIVEGTIGVENETGIDKPPLSSPLIASTPENQATNSDKRSSLVRTRTTASKFLTSTRRAPEQQSSSTVATSTTTETVLPEDLQEDVYTDKRVAELALSGPEYPSTEKEEIIESETIVTDLNDETLKDVIQSELIVSEGESNSAPVVERPAGLQNELLAAIRRKITQNRSNVTTTTTTKAPETTSTTITTKTPITFVGGNEQRLPNNSFENNDVSPDSNIISSTQHPTFFKPIPFPSDRNRSGTSKESVEGPSSPRVQFFVRVPNSKPGSQVKIPEISHIQGKLARLNAAITEGLQEQRKQQQQDRNSSNEQEEEQLEITAAPSTTTISAISPTTEASNEESLMVLTSTSVSSIFSVVTGSSQIKSATTTAPPPPTTSTTTTASTTQTVSTTAIPLRVVESVTPRLASGRDETGTEKNVEATSKASSVSEIITIGKTELRNPESSTDKPLGPPIAQKTHTYLDRLRESRNQPSTVPPTTTSTTTTSSSRTTTVKNKPATTKKQQVINVI